MVIDRPIDPLCRSRLLLLLLLPLLEGNALRLFAPTRILANRLTGSRGNACHKLVVVRRASSSSSSAEEEEAPAPVEATSSAGVALESVLRLRGEVAAGYGRGSRKLGFPTANLPSSLFGEALADWPAGVYFGFARVRFARSLARSPQTHASNTKPIYPQNSAMTQQFALFWGCFDLLRPTCLSACLPACPPA